MEKTGIFNVFSASVSICKTSQESKAPETHGKAWSRKDLPFVKKDHVRVREHLDSLDIQMFMGLMVMHPWILRELA